jgi:prepilin-type N-terminal cleavage/methylation domain-containing protein
MIMSTLQLVLTHVFCFIFGGIIGGLLANYLIARKLEETIVRAFFGLGGKKGFTLVEALIAAIALCILLAIVGSLVAVCVIHFRH